MGTGIYWYFIKNYQRYIQWKL